MSTITSFLAALGPWNWLIAAVVLMLLESIVPGIHFVWFGMAAAATGTLALAAGAVGLDALFTWPFQVIVFGLLALVSVVFVRRYAMAEANVSDQPDLNERAAQYVGRTFVVAEPIKDGRGKIKVGDSLWMAEGPDLPHGAHVRVTATRNTVLVIEPA